MADLMQAADHVARDFLTGKRCPPEFHVAVTRAKDELYLCRPVEAKRPWDTGANRVVMNSGMGFLDRDLGDLVEEWSVR